MFACSTLVYESYLIVCWKCLLLKAPLMRPSSTPRAAPRREKEKTANHSFQLKTSFGMSKSFSLKTFTGFFTPPAILSVCVGTIRERRCHKCWYELGLAESGAVVPNYQLSGSGTFK
jgi:hypothetical protein